MCNQQECPFQKHHLGLNLKLQFTKDTQIEIPFKKFFYVQDSKIKYRFRVGTSSQSKACHLQPALSLLLFEGLVVQYSILDN